MSSNVRSAFHKLQARFGTFEERGVEEALQQLHGSYASNGTRKLGLDDDSALVLGSSMCKADFPGDGAPVLGTGMCKSGFAGDGHPRALVRSSAVASARLVLRVTGFFELLTTTFQVGTGMCNAGFADDDDPRAAPDSGQCKAGFVGDDYPRAAPGSGQYEAGFHC